MSVESIKAWKAMLKAQGRTKRIYNLGADIVEKNAPNNGIKRLILAGRVNPKFKHWDHLLHSLKKISGFQVRLSHVPKTTAPVKKKKVKVEKTERIDPGTLQVGNLKLKVLQDGDLETVTRKIRELARERVKLSNKLIDPGDDKELIRHNCNILDELDPINEEIKRLKLRKNDLVEGKAFKEEDPIIIETKKESWRLSELYEMDMQELDALRRRVSRFRRNARDRSTRLKTEAGKKKAAKEAKKYTYYLSVVDKVRIDKKFMENET